MYMEEVYLMNKLYIALSLITLSTNVTSFCSPGNISNNAYIDRLMVDNFLNAENKLKVDFGGSFICDNPISNSLNVSANTYNMYGVDNLNSEQRENLDILSSFKTLEDNWDDCDAIAPKKEIIEIAQKLVKKLQRQPEIFPTPDGGVQFEYDREQNRHLNIEILSEQKVNIFEMFSDRTYKEEIFDLDVENIKQRVDEFYGGV